LRRKAADVSVYSDILPDKIREIVLEVRVFLYIADSPSLEVGDDEAELELLEARVGEASDAERGTNAQGTKPLLTLRQRHPRLPPVCHRSVCDASSLSSDVREIQP
jgi:hypothetical protein